MIMVTHDVDEAIFMGDTIYVMTARPGKIKARLEVPLLRSRTYDMKLADGFVNLKKQALELIREESWKTANSNM